MIDKEKCETQLGYENMVTQVVRHRAHRATVWGLLVPCVVCATLCPDSLDLICVKCMEVTPWISLAHKKGRGGG